VGCRCFRSFFPAPAAGSRKADNSFLLEPIMRHIDIETWPRRDYYRMYRQIDQPHFNMCANVDVTAFYEALKTRAVPFTVGVLYILARAANDIPAFRCRMRGDDVIEHETVHPATTILSDEGLFGFCTIGYRAAFGSFVTGATEAIAAAKRQPTIEVEGGRDDLLYTTSIPWVSFTSFAHPTHLHPSDSIPRLAWGKRFDEDSRLKMPLSVQGHHAMMDGFHMGQYYERAQAYFIEPDAVLDRAEA
jgi:chloramphenicol O-acetyltransferase type A